MQIISWALRLARTLRAAPVMVSALAAVSFPHVVRSQAPVFEFDRADSRINFHVRATVKIAGKFDHWDATLAFTSPDETTGVLEITIQSASVDTGSGMKNGKLKSKDFFDVEQNPLIVFKSTKFVQIAPHTFEVDGDFTIRGVSNPEKLVLTVSGKGSSTGEVKGSMVFNRKDYGMNKGIPFIKIADHVDVNFHLKGMRVAGPPLAHRKEETGGGNVSSSTKSR
jgi:polyisoprenoid-binding protein YceI